MIGSTESALLQLISNNLGVPSSDLYNLINFESGWNPLKKNPVSSARGLIQFTDATARSLGFMDSLDLVAHNRTIAEQLPIVERYLLKFKPFPTRQSLYMSVFYPDARNWDANRRFPESVISKNPGIYTPNHYAARVERRYLKGGEALFLFAAAVSYLFYKYFLKRKD